MSLELDFDLGGDQNRRVDFWFLLRMKRAGKCTTPTLTTTTKNQITTKSQLANATDRLGLRVTNLQSKERQELPRRERI